MKQMSIRFVKKITLPWALMAVLLLNPSCESFIEVAPPKTQLTTETVFGDDLTATAAVSGLYVYMSVSGVSAGTGLTLLGGLLSDETIFYVSNPNYFEANTNSLVSANTVVRNLWADCYGRIYQANVIVEALEQSTGLTPAIRDRLEAEARFIRAFHHFYLVNLYGDAPYIVTTDYRLNTLADRTPKAQIYAGIIEDLTRAQSLLSDDYVNGDKGRINKSTVIAFLSRVYLYLQDWSNAEANASLVIGNGLYALAEPDKVFLRNSSEAIWQLIPQNSLTNNYTTEGNTYFRTTTVSLRTDFVEPTFEPGDLRMQNWIGFDPSTSRYYCWKYKERAGTGTGAEYSMVIRLAEIYLIRAEARARQGNLTGPDGAVADINVIRARAGLNATTAATLDDVLLAIEQERKAEFFNEWGHRWLDLVRTERATAVLSPIKPDWAETDVLFPIPESEMLLNPNLKPQNPGY